MLCPLLSQPPGQWYGPEGGQDDLQYSAMQKLLWLGSALLFYVQEAQEFAVKLAGATADQDKARRLEGETRDLQAAHVHIEQVEAGAEFDMIHTERASPELRCVRCTASRGSRQANSQAGAGLLSRPACQIVEA